MIAGLPRQKSRRTGHVRSSWRCVWLLGGVGIGLAAIQFTRERTTSLQIGDCAAVHEDASRLRCYDTVARRPPPDPARGSPLP
jgi:hypothetical protein